MNLEETRIFFWQTSIEHLVYYTWSAVQSYFKVPFTYIVHQLQRSERVAQNWKLVDLESIKPILISPKKVWQEGIKILRENPDAIHVFGGFSGLSKSNTLPLILYALERGIKLVIISESYSISPVGYFSDEPPLLGYLKTFLRPVFYYSISKLTYVFSKYQKPCIMVLSLIAKDQFLKAGFNPRTLFPFGYFVPKKQIITHKYTKSANKLRLVFVGALIKRKGLDILEQAVKILHDQGYKIELDVFGAGLLKLKCPDLPIYNKGTIPYDEIQAVIAEHDILILPSRHDGWGVVVNEALLQGVPVIVSDKVGAKCIIETTGAGLIFKNEDYRDLARKIEQVIEDPDILTSLQDKASQISNLILPETAARYFVDVLDYYFFGYGSRPQALWCGKEVNSF